MGFAHSDMGIWLVLAGGIFAAAIAVFNWSFFFSYYRARAIAKVLGAKGARIFYAVAGVILIVVGTSLLIEKHSAEKKLNEFLSHAQSGSYFYMKTSDSKSAKVIPFQIVQVEPGLLIIKRGRIRLVRPISIPALQNLRTPDGLPIIYYEAEAVGSKDIDPLLFIVPPQE